MHIFHFVSSVSVSATLARKLSPVQTIRPSRNMDSTTLQAGTKHTFASVLNAPDS